MTAEVVKRKRGRPRKNPVQVPGGVTVPIGKPGRDGTSNNTATGKDLNAKKGGRRAMKHKAIAGGKGRDIYGRNKRNTILRQLVGRYRCTQKGGMVVLCGCDGKLHVLKTPGFDAECQRHLDDHANNGTGGIALTTVDEIEEKMKFPWDEEDMTRNPWNRHTITMLKGSENEGYTYGSAGGIRDGLDLIKAVCDAEETSEESPEKFVSKYSIEEGLIY